MDNILLHFEKGYGDFCAFFSSVTKFNKDIKKENDIFNIKVCVDKSNEDEKMKITYDITDLILEILKKSTVKSLAIRSYKELYPLEIDYIYNHAVKKIEDKESFLRGLIFSKVYDYISNNDFINIGGFIEFRLKDLFDGINRIIDEGCEEYLLEKDYNEFIELLKYFVSSQGEKENLLKIYIQDDGKFKLCDENDFPLENECGKDMMNMVIKENLNYEDFLMSMLITLCPKKILIYDNLKNNTSKEVIQTIKAIFTDRVSINYKS